MTSTIQRCRAYGARRVLLVLFGAFVPMGCSSSTDPLLNFNFSFRETSIDVEANEVVGDGTIFPESFRLQIEDLPGIDVQVRPIEVEVLGVFVSPCSPTVLEPDARLSEDRIFLAVRHVAGPDCGGDPLPISFSGVFTLLPAGSYEVEVEYLNTALVGGQEFTARFPAFSGDVVVTGPR